MILSVFFKIVFFCTGDSTKMATQDFHVGPSTSNQCIICKTSMENGYMKTSPCCKSNFHSHCIRKQDNCPKCDAALKHMMQLFGRYKRKDGKNVGWTINLFEDDRWVDLAYFIASSEKLPIFCTAGFQWGPKQFSSESTQLVKESNILNESTLDVQFSSHVK